MVGYGLATLVACSMAGQRDRRAPPLPDELPSCDGQRFRWPETLQLLKQLSKAVGALPNTFASLIFDRLTCAPQVSLLLEVSWCRTPSIGGE